MLLVLLLGRKASISARVISLISAPAADNRSIAAAKLLATCGSRSSNRYPLGRASRSPFTTKAGSSSPNPPAIKLSKMAQHDTVFAIGPAASKDRDSGKIPSDGMRVVVGFRPTIPQKAAGARVDPPVSDPIVAGAMPSLIETALPDDDPPATRPLVMSFGSRSNGQRASP